MVATVPVKPITFTDALKKRPDVTLFRVTVSNRDELPGQIYTKLNAVMF
ncbi:MAG: nucleoside-triphosphatase [Bacillota bacterium]